MLFYPLLEWAQEVTVLPVYELGNAKAGSVALASVMSKQALLSYGRSKDIKDARCRGNTAMASNDIDP